MAGEMLGNVIGKDKSDIGLHDIVQAFNAPVISWDVRTAKSSKYQNVHVSVPGWLLLVGVLFGGSIALVLLNEIMEEVTGEPLIGGKDEEGKKSVLEQLAAMRGAEE